MLPAKKQKRKRICRCRVVTAQVADASDGEQTKVVPRIGKLLQEKTCCPLKKVESTCLSEARCNKQKSCAARLGEHPPEQTQEHQEPPSTVP